LLHQHLAQTAFNLCLPGHGSRIHATTVLFVAEARAAEIRATFEKGG
jgi:hypothetical protein